MNQQTQNTSLPNLKPASAERRSITEEEFRSITREHSNHLYNDLLPALRQRPFIEITEEGPIVTGSLPLNVYRIIINHEKREVSVQTLDAQNPTQVTPLTPQFVTLSTRSRSWHSLMSRYHEWYATLLTDRLAMDSRTQQSTQLFMKIIWQEAMKLKYQLTGESNSGEFKKLTVALNKLLPKDIMRATMRYAGVTGSTIDHFNSTWAHYEDLQLLSPSVATAFIMLTHHGFIKSTPRGTRDIEEAVRSHLQQHRGGHLLSKRAWRYLHKLTTAQARAVLYTNQPAHLLNALAATQEVPRLTTLEHLRRVWEDLRHGSDEQQTKVFTAYARTISRHTKHLRGIKRFHDLNLLDVADFINSQLYNGVAFDKNQLNSPPLVVGQQRLRMAPAVH